MNKSNHVVLIHGNFVNDRSWAEWKRHYEALGYTVHAPANPGHAGDPTALRTDIHPDLARTGFIDVVDNIARLIDTLPEKPLVVGHSMAGMATLKLVEMGKASAGVSIDGAPPKNVFPPFQTLKTVLPAFGFLSFKPYFMGSRPWYDYAFFNTLPESQRRAAYDAFAVPESVKVSRQLVLNSFSNIDFTRRHAPLLFIGGGMDHIFPPGLTRRIAARYTDPDSRVDVKVFDGKSHFLCGEPGWEAVADYVHDWYQGVGDATEAVADPAVARA
jgi:pimeloyl-ACP methyl ester carboxylesterase